MNKKSNKEYLFLAVGGELILPKIVIASDKEQALQRVGVKKCARILPKCPIDLKKYWDQAHGWYYRRNIEWKLIVYELCQIHKGKTSCIGFFKTENEAADTYDQKAIKLFGKFAKLNF